MLLTLNGRGVETTALYLHKLLQEQGLQPESKGIAVAINGEIVPRSEWATTELGNGDAIEMITAMQGG